MKAYRYNTINREDRKFNNCGSEKNPNAIKFFARSMDYAKRYQFVYFEDGDINYECKLETAEVSDESYLFDMANNFATLDVYKAYIDDNIALQMNDYKSFLANSKTVAEKMRWQQQIDNLASRKVELDNALRANEFQFLSDFDYQNILVAELKAKGFQGYFTKNEIALF